jgi:hypothetical protein
MRAAPGLANYAGSCEKRFLPCKQARSQTCVLLRCTQARSQTCVLPPLPAGEGWGGFPLILRRRGDDECFARYAKLPLWEMGCILQVRDCSALPGPHPSALRAPGPARGCPKLFQTILSNQRVRPPPLSARYAKRPLRIPGVLWVRGLFGPSMGQTPTRYALRGQPAAVQFCSRQNCRTLVRPPPLSARYAKRPLRGALRIWRREREMIPLQPRQALPRLAAPESLTSRVDQVH